jgi:hypothetical protein
VQDPITAAGRDAMVGREVEVLVDGTDEDTGDVTGRTEREAPEIDGRVRLRGGYARPGSLVRVRVAQACGPDLVADGAALSTGAAEGAVDRADGAAPWADAREGVAEGAIDIERAS